MYHDLQHRGCSSLFLGGWYEAGLRYRIQHIELLQTSLGIPEDQDDRVSSQKHLGDEAVLVDWLRSLLALASLWHLEGNIRT